LAEAEIHFDIPFHKNGSRNFHLIVGNIEASWFGFNIIIVQSTKISAKGFSLSLCGL
jgi:hypothetical protein